MKRRFVIFFLIFACTGYTIFYIELANMPVVNVLYDRKSKEPVYKEKEAILLSFIQKHLIDENGGIFTNIKPSQDSIGTLSESIGLLMNYSVLRDRRDLFDSAYSFFKKNLLENNRYVKWKSGSGIVTCGAVIDDLRIIRALLDADEKWKDGNYAVTAGFIQEYVHDKLVINDNLREFYDWRSDTRRNSIPLCYLDLYTLHRIGIFNKGWLKVAENGLDMINNGRIGESRPFFYKYYNYESGLYSMDEEAVNNKGICLTYTLYTGLHLAEMNEDTGFLTEWLKNEMEDNVLNAWYNPETIEPVNGMESTAVYALAAIYSKKAGENELTCRLLDKMLQFMVTDIKSPYYGGFGNEDSSEFHAFDNLTALWALAGIE